MSNRLGKVFEETNRDWNGEKYDNDEFLATDGRVMDSMLSEHMCEGWLEGYILTGRHGFFASYEAFIRIIDSMAAQHAKWLKVTSELPWRQKIASLNLILSSNVWQQDHNGFTHQDPGFLDHISNKKADVARIYLPPDANCLLSCFDHCIRSKNYVKRSCNIKAPTSAMAYNGTGCLSTVHKVSVFGIGHQTIRVVNLMLYLLAAVIHRHLKFLQQLQFFIRICLI